MSDVPNPVLDELVGLEGRAGRAGWRAPIAAGLLVCAVLAAICVAMWIRFDGRIVWPKLQDDAYYYYVVAHNVTHGQGLTLDGANWTNGFHPLWFLCVLPIYAVADLGSHTAIMVIHGLSLAIYGVTVALLFGVVRAMGVREQVAWIIALCAMFGPFISHGVSGMEGVLSVPLLLLVARALVVRPDVLSPQMVGVSASDCARLGFLLGLLMLARLDCVFVLFAVAAAIVVRGLTGSGGWWRRVWRIALRGVAVFWPACVLVVPYLMWNASHTGRMVPISGALKSSFPVVEWQGQWLTRFPQWFALLGPMVVAAAMCLLPGLGSRTLWQRYRAAVLPLVAGALLHATYTLLFCRWAVHGWHFVQYIPAALLSAAVIFESACRTVEHRGWRPQPLVYGVGAVAAALVAASLVVSVASGSRESFRTVALDAAVWARANTGPDAVYAMKDCGVFAYYSGRRCVNLDGIINSWGFQEVLASDGLAAYFASRPVHYLVRHMIPIEQSDYEQMVLSYKAKLYPPKGSSVVVRRDQEVWRSQPYDNDGRLGFLAIWRLP